MTQQKSFSFSADCKAFEQSIKKVVAVAGPTSAFFIMLHKKKVCVVGLGTDTFAMLEVPNSETTDTSGIFGFAADVLPGLIKGRAVMEFKQSGGECAYAQTKGRYSGKITANVVTEDQLETITARIGERAKGTVDIDADMWSSIKSGIDATSVKDVYQNTTLMSYVTLTKDGNLQISSFDPQHFGMYRTKVGKGVQFKVALPQSHFSLVGQLSNGTDTTFSITPSRLRAYGTGFIAILPATQAEDRHFNMVPDFIKNLPKAEYEAVCGVDKLAVIADNLFTLYNANSNFIIKTKSDALTLGLSTSSGSASDAVRVKTQSPDSKFSIDPRLLMDVLSLAKPCKTVSLKVTDKVMLLSGKIGDADVSIACSRIE